MTDFSAAQRMSAGALPIIFLKSIKSVISIYIVALTVNVFKSGSLITDSTVPTRILTVTAIVIIVVMLMTVAIYFSKKFYIKEGSLIFTHGIVRRETITIPLTRIHSMRTNKGILYQILGLRGIAFDTLASKTEEIELILDETDWQYLLQLIEQEEHPQNRCIAASGHTHNQLMRFSNMNLLLDALCQNHLKGASILLGIVVAIMESVGDISGNDTRTITYNALEYLDGLEVSPVHIAVMLAGIYLIVLALWLGKVLLRYFDMSLAFDKTLLTFNYGLISHASSRFPFHKICTIWVKRNYWEKKSGLCTLMLRQAYNVTAIKEEDNLKIYGADTSSFFLRWWLGEDYAVSPEILSSRSGNGMLIHTLLPAAAICATAIIILCHFQLFIWMMLPAIYFALSLLKGVYAVRRSRITLRETYVLINNGRFADIRNYIKYGDIEVVRIRHTPFTRWFHRVTLILSTSGSTFTVRSIKEEDAKFIYEYLLCKSEDIATENAGEAK